MGKNLIIINKFDKYLLDLKNILNEIRTLEKLNKDIKSGMFDSNIKYRSSWNKNLTELEPKYYQERDKWVDFVYLIEQNKILEIEDLLYENKIKLILLLFWRDIANNLSSNAKFKLQLKLNLTFIIDNDDYNNINLDNSILDQIRSVGSIRIYSKKNFKEAFSYFNTSLYLLLDNYSDFYIRNIILTYNICLEDSILNKLEISNFNFNSLMDVHSKNIYAKVKLKINDKKLPLTTDLTQWGEIQSIKGDFPYSLGEKESIIFIKNVNQESKISLNYIVSIKGIEFNDKKNNFT